jgi:hypothetical protein
VSDDDEPPKEPPEEEMPDHPWRFDGEFYDPALDLVAHPHTTVREVAKRTGYEAQCVAAQIQHLRKPRYGQYPVIATIREGTRVAEYVIGKKGEGVPRLSYWHARALADEAILRVVNAELDRLYEELENCEKRNRDE